jgi:Phosphotransferase enzyme family
MCVPIQLDHDLFRILLYGKDGREILLETTWEGFRLPVLSVPTHSRTAEEVTAAIRNAWNLDAYCLFSLSDSTRPQALVRDHAVEACDPGCGCPAGMEWLPVASLSEGVFQSPSDFIAMENSLRTFEQYRRDELPGFFGKPGWLRKVTEWVEAQAGAAGLCLTGRFRQLNASPTFSLIRFETDGPAVWFKAVGDPNVREFRITRALAHHLHGYVTPILAMHTDWNAWLTAEVAGKHPDENSEVETWVAVARTLADLQIASFGKTFHFINVGCHDTRISALAEMIDPFLQVADGLMEQQTKTSPSRLSTAELLVLGSQMRKVFSTLAQSDFPSALGHLDLNPANILVSDYRCLFLDWAEACVGHPFVAFQCLLEHLRKLRPTNTWETKIASVYSQGWEAFVDT